MSPDPGDGRIEEFSQEDLFGGRPKIPVSAQPPSEELRRLGRILPGSVRLGSSSWAFPGWKGIVWGTYSSTENLANEGLPAYSRHPLLRTAGIDRAYYQPLGVGQYRRFYAQVPEDFHFLIKAPALVCDPSVRDGKGRRQRDNPSFLDTGLAESEFIAPVIEGLREKAGPLVFQLSAFPREWISSRDRRLALIDRLGTFFSGLPGIGQEGSNAFYAVEVRTPEIYTPRFVGMLREIGVRLVVGLHPLMPDVLRQTSALLVSDGIDPSSHEPALKGPLVVRWSLGYGDRFENARRRLAPFSSLQQPDPMTREGIANLVMAAVRGRQRAYVVANNKAEGCAPLSMQALAERIVSKLIQDRDRREKIAAMPSGRLIRK